MDATEPEIEEAPEIEEEPEFEEDSPRHLGRGWRIAVVALGTVVLAVAFVIIGVAFMRGSSWYFYSTDRALDADSRARVEEIRDAVEASGTVPDAVMWLNAALQPNVDPTAVRLNLTAAHAALEATDDAELAETERELQTIIGKLSAPEVINTLRPVPTLASP